MLQGMVRKENKRLEKLKKNIKNGVKYDFVYSESINIPTVLSEENHIPIYPFLDFFIFYILQKSRIKNWFVL